MPAAALAVLILFLVSASRFAGFQAIWIDETTQLSGLTLSFKDQLAWLTGNYDPGFGVPPDRMPPLSYWAGSLWAAVFGLSETAMRWFGIVAVLAAAPAVWLAGVRAGGQAGGLLALAIGLLSPNLTVVAVEIRTYPLFFALSAWAVWALTRCLAEPRSGGSITNLGFLSLFTVLGAYAHFYGVVMGAALWATLLLARLLAREAVVVPMLAGLMSAAAMVGIIPFVTHAAGISGGMVPGPVALTEAIADAIRLGARLVLHASHGVWRAALALSVVGLVLLALLSLLNVRRRDMPEPGRLPGTAVAALWLTLVFSFAGLTGLNLVLRGFDTLSPQYNVWMVPLLITVLASAVPGPGAPFWRRGMAGAGAIALVAGHLIATAAFQRFPVAFTHGPGEWVAGLIVEPARTLVRHDPAGQWPHVYFPVRYMYGGAVEQILIRADGSAKRITPNGLIPIDDLEAFYAGFETVLDVSVSDRGATDLAAVLRGERPCFQPADPTGETYCAFAAARVSSAADL